MFVESNKNFIDSIVCLDINSSRPISSYLKVKDDVEELVNACLDTSGIDRRYSAIILEELRDCTNMTHDQLRAAAQELTTTLGNPSVPSSNSAYVYDSSIRRV